MEFSFPCGIISLNANIVIGPSLFLADTARFIEVTDGNELTFLHLLAIEAVADEPSLCNGRLVGVVNGKPHAGGVVNEKARLSVIGFGHLHPHPRLVHIGRSEVEDHLTLGDIALVHIVGVFSFTTTYANSVP